jgi:hypothetical protein
MAGMAGMDAAAQALQPKPAIDSGGGTARNGNSSQVAPTTVQPVQPAGSPQATQVSPAPTQVQRAAGVGSGPANGGSPAATQVTKQANGKDDEDWWTE